jgi:hypothetical protein
MRPVPLRRNQLRDRPRCAACKRRFAVNEIRVTTATGSAHPRCLGAKAA